VPHLIFHFRLPNIYIQTLSLLPGFLGGGPENAAALVDDRWLHGMASLACLGLPIVGAYVLHVAFELPLLWQKEGASVNDRNELAEVSCVLCMYI
jgi:hypothetical protein